MEINRKDFPGLYWLGRCFVSFLAAVIVMALLAPSSERLTAAEFSVALGVLWIVAVWANIPKWIAWCLDALGRIVAWIGREAILKAILEAIKDIGRAIRAFVAAVRLVFWPVVAGFLTWKLCEWVWRIFVRT